MNIVTNLFWSMVGKTPENTVVEFKGGAVNTAEAKDSYESDAFGSKELKIIAKGVTCNSLLVNQMAISGAFGSRGVSNSLKRKLIDAIRLTNENAPQVLKLIAENAGFENNVREYAIGALGKINAVNELLEFARNMDETNEIRLSSLTALSACPCKTEAVIESLEGIINGGCLGCSTDMKVLAQETLEIFMGKEPCPELNPGREEVAFNVL